MNSRFTSHAKPVQHAKAITTIAVSLSFCLISVNVMAMTVPVAGSFAYDLYDIGVNQILLVAP